MEELIENFYKAFAAGDAQTMSESYHSQLVFQDPIFGPLNKIEASAMWAMLIERAAGQLQIKYGNISAHDNRGQCKWEATYKFGNKKRQVHNIIYADFRFSDGKIIRHLDQFNFWKWSQMALGIPGYLLGFTPIIRNQVKNKSDLLLKKYLNKSR
ncbi:MAG: nuclear transport factor 2 family protein [Cyclobacteriaceae bacterium]|nr:nuclear transport factor 2 family protein [Cyclobacteriaceae bacterium HetDA_MAG_MS6]